jgi:predicted transcriptional regulator
MLIAVIVLLTLHHPSRNIASKTGQTVIGICMNALEQTNKKEQRKQRIITMLEDNELLDNATIRDRLDVSARTVVNYMNELEIAGQVEQVGNIGWEVRYRIKK